MSKKQTFINLVCQMCDDDSHGYDQTNRWGPDFDCTSLCYYCAHHAGYNVQVGSGYSGTLRADFVKAGWKAVPFGKSSAITGLTAGSIMLREGHHAEVVITGTQWGGAHCNEQGGATGGKTGDQTGKEICRCAPYHYGTYPNDWDYVIVPPEEAEPKPSQPDSKPVNSAGIYYQSHSQSIGWNAQVHDGMTSGTIGLSKRLEALKFDFSKASITIDSVKLHIQGIGWKTYTNPTSSTIVGTVGESRRLEAIELNCSNIPSGKKLMYRVHVQGIGWQNWVENGYACGTIGQSKRIEAIEIKLI